MIPYMAKIEYLESTGTQYINTGMLPNATDTLNIDFKLPILNSGAIMGFRYKTRNNLVELWCSASNKFQAATGDVDLTNIADADTEMHHFSINPKSGTATLDGNSTYVGNYTVNNPRRPYLFCTGIGNVASNFSRVRIYRFYIEGKIDLVPIRIGSVGYMYDKISGNLFGNSGTGKFVLGPDVEILSYANEIAFLESTGSQYIDTGIKPTNNTRFVITMDLPKMDVSDLAAWFFGSRNGAYDAECGLMYYRASNQRTWIWKYGNLQIVLNNEPSSGVTVFDNYTTSGANELKINNLTLSATANTFTGSYNFYLFTYNVAGTPALTNCLVGQKLISAKLYEGTTLVRDFIPVEYNNIGYMYDKVSGQFFANQGTGKFVLGHRAPRFDGKACARSYTRRQLMAEIGKPYDAEIEYLQSTASSGFNVVTDKEFSPQCTFELKYKIDNILGMYDQQSYFSRVTTPFRTPSVFMGSRANNYYYKAIDATGKEKYLLRINSRNTNIHTLTVNFENKTVTLDGAQSAFANSFTQYTVPSKIHIFGAIDSSHFGLYGKIYYFKISKNNQVLLDLIPVRKGNIGYMFDKVSRSILKNTGTGTFILGPDKNI